MVITNEIQRLIKEFYLNVAERDNLAIKESRSRSDHFTSTYLRKRLHRVFRHMDNIQKQLKEMGYHI